MLCGIICGTIWGVVVYMVVVGAYRAPANPQTFQNPHTICAWFVSHLLHPLGCLMWGFGGKLVVNVYESHYG